MHTSLRIAGPLFVAALAVSSAACSRSDKTSEGAGSQGVSANAPVTAVALPADFPRSVPIYPGALVTAAAKSADPAGKPAWSVTATSAAPLANVVKFYKENMNDIRLKHDTSEADKSTTEWGNAAYDVTIAAAGAGGATTLAITVVGK